MKLTQEDVENIKKFLKKQIWLLIITLIIVFTLIGAIS